MYDADQRWLEILQLEESDINQLSVQDIQDEAESWLLPEQYKFVVRVRSLKNGKVKEKAYKSSKAAESFLKKIDTEQVEVTIYSQETMKSNYCSGG